MERRLPPRPAEKIDRSKKLTFIYNGKRVEAYEGDTVASALYAKGQTTFGRSFKYHRARGLLCVSGRCPNCMMNIDGQPNTRACTTYVREGMVADHENAWPSLEHDIGSIADKFSFLLPVGFYYKTFIRPKWAWPLARRFIRRFAGFGEVNISLQGPFSYEHVYKHVDIAVVGGGPAGLTAALEAAKLGFKVLLIDDQRDLGGHLRFKLGVCRDGGEFSGMKGFEVASKLLAEVASRPNIEVLREATCFGLYEGGLLGVAQGTKLVKVRAKKIIAATGCHERPFVFPNNDLPGIFLGSGLHRLVNLYGVRPGLSVVVVTNNDYGYEVASELVEAGLKIVFLADARDKVTTDEASLTRLRERGVRILESYTIVRALGGKAIEGAVVAKIDEQGNIIPGSEMTFKCDTVALSVGFEPAIALLYQGGCELKFDEELGETVPHKMQPGLYAAGEVTGIHHLQVILLQGRLAGLQAVVELTEGGDPPATVTVTAPIMRPETAREVVSQYLDRLRELINKYRERFRLKLLISVPLEGKKFVCICEDITEKDMRTAIEEGFNDVEILKRYTTFSMGPCQGKMCNLASIAICAKAMGLGLSKSRTTTSRPPYQPVAMGLLAGPPRRPLKLTAIHRKHLALQAKLMDMGEWKRPHDYGSIEDEYRAIRERVGIIDVSTLGRFDVKGLDAGKFLETIYGHIYSSLKIGKARYAPLFTDAGMVLDDGIIARLGEDHYLVTSSSGRTDTVEEWLRWWLAQSDMCVHITNVTSGLAAVNVAGPKARELLSKLADVDLSPEAFPYMTCARANVAGVPAILLRIGFVGETGWEIHFAAEYGEYMWDVIVNAGKDYGIRAVGVEAMRTLSLEKRHIWPGVDTDAASDALESDLAWAVKFEKEDFVGKHYLLRTQQKGLQRKIIGFIVRGSIIVENGDVIIHNGKPVGRVTNARYSYSLKQCVGMSWVPIELAKDGSIIKIRHNGKLIDSEVVSGAFYDPEGKKLKA